MPLALMPDRANCITMRSHHMTRFTAPPFELRGGPGAVQHVSQQGLAPADIACIPAAAGGPKGLALIPLDRLLCHEWLARIRSRWNSSAPPSVPGAWRPWRSAIRLAALDRVQHAYVHDQCYNAKPTLWT